MGSVEELQGVVCSNSIDSTGDVVHDGNYSIPTGLKIDGRDHEDVVEYNETALLNSIQEEKDLGLYVDDDEVVYTSRSLSMSEFDSTYRNDMDSTSDPSSFLQDVLSSGEYFSSAENSDGQDEQPNAASMKRIAESIMKNINLFGLHNYGNKYHEVLKILSKYRDECSKKGQYELCEGITEMIDALKVESDKAKVQLLHTKQEEERVVLLEACSSEYEQVDKKWREKIAEMKLEIEYAKNALALKHEQEIEEFSESFYEDVKNRTPKFSTHLLNMRKVQETLAKNKNYTDAIRVKKDADMLQNDELLRLSKENEERYEKKKATILQKQKQEMSSLEVRMERELSEMEIQRDKELEIIKRRNINVKQSIEGHHSVVESKTRSFMTKHSHDRRFSVPNSEWITNAKASSEPFHFSTTNINSDVYQSRPFSIPKATIRRDSQVLSEMSKSVTTSMIRMEKEHSPYKPLQSPSGKKRPVPPITLSASPPTTQIYHASAAERRSSSTGTRLQRAINNSAANPSPMRSSLTLKDHNNNNGHTVPQSPGGISRRRFSQTSPSKLQSSTLQPISPSPRRSKGTPRAK